MESFKNFREENSKPKSHGIKSDPAYKAARTQKEIKNARDQWNLKNPKDLWVGESVEVGESRYDEIIKRKIEKERIEQERKGPKLKIKLGKGKKIGTKIADIGPGGKEHNVKTDAEWDAQKAHDPMKILPYTPAQWAAHKKNTNTESVELDEYGVHTQRPGTPQAPEGGKYAVELPKSKVKRTKRQQQIIRQAIAQNATGARPSNPSDLKDHVELGESYDEKGLLKKGLTHAVHSKSNGSIHFTTRKKKFADFKANMYTNAIQFTQKDHPGFDIKIVPHGTPHGKSVHKDHEKYYGKTDESVVEETGLKDTTLQNYMRKVHKKYIKGQQKGGSKKTIKAIEGFMKAKEKLNAMGAKTPAVIDGVVQGDRINKKKLGTGNVYKADTIQGKKITTEGIWKDTKELVKDIIRNPRKAAPKQGDADFQPLFKKKPKNKKSEKNRP